MAIRNVKRLVKAKPTLEGAGVRSAPRVRIRQHVRLRSVPPAGRFPQRHPGGLPGRLPVASRIAASRPSPTCSPGTVEHGDSMGNRGAIAAGDIQWMTAGRGIVHQEMPKGDAGGPDARLPALGQPAGVAQDDRAALPGGQGGRDPRVTRRRRHRRCASCAAASGGRAARGRHRRRAHLSRRLGAGRQAQDAPGRDDAPRLRLRLRGRAESSATPRRRWRCRPKAVGWADTTPPDGGGQPLAGALRPRRRGRRCRPGDEGIRFLLVSGKPLEEPVAWYGPIVMNTQEQLRHAFEELEAGTFLKPRREAVVDSNRALPTEHAFELFDGAAVRNRGA